MSRFDHGIDALSARDVQTLADGLGRRPLARLLADRALSKGEADDGSVIGVYGTWGSGKSFVLDLTVDELFQRNGYPRPIVCLFEPWRYEPDTSLAPGLITALQSVPTQFPGKNPRLSGSGLSDAQQAGKRVKTLMRAAVGWLNAVADVAGAGLTVLPPGIFPGQAAVTVGTAVAGQATERIISYRGVDPGDIRTWDPAKIKSGMTELIEALRAAAAAAEGGSPRDYRVVVVVDDLDRCAPDLMVDMLNWLKVHLTVAGCSYLLALDHEAAARAIIGRYRAYLGDQADVAYGLRYLEKIVDFEVELAKSPLVEAMATQPSQSMVQIVDAALGRQGVREADIDRFMKLACLQSPRTMMKVVDRFRLGLRAVEEREEYRLRTGSGAGGQLPADYAFWLLLLVGMYYRLAPDDIEAFCAGHGPLATRRGNAAARHTGVSDPMSEFSDFLDSVAQEGRSERAPSPQVLQELYSVVRQLAVS